MPKDKEVTIYDLAKELNISATTVSRALRNHPHVGKITAKKIHDLALRRGFQPNNFASSLRKNKSYTVGVIVHELNTSFMVSVLSGIENVLGDTEYDILIAHSAEKGKKEIANLNSLFNKRVDGVIASLAFDTPNLQHFERFTEKKIPVVFFDRVEEKSIGAKVIIDNFKGGYDITKHLISQGCKRIAHLTGNLNRNVYQKRLDGYKAALAESGITFDNNLVFVTDLNKEESQKAAGKIMRLKPRPDALFAAGDFPAAICIQSFKSAGLSVPGDIAVAGFNNDVISTIIEPNLTTINYSGFNMGEKAARLLLDHLNGDDDIQFTDTIIMNAELIVRESTIKK